MKNKELKPCPFCGSDKIEKLHVVQHYMVCCINCNAMVGLFDEDQDAVNNWNRRAEE